MFYTNFKVFQDILSLIWNVENFENFILCSFCLIKILFFILRSENIGIYVISIFIRKTSNIICHKFFLHTFLN